MDSVDKSHESIVVEDCDRPAPSLIAGWSHVDGGTLRVPLEGEFYLSLAAETFPPAREADFCYCNKTRPSYGRRWIVEKTKFSRGFVVLDEENRK